VVTSDAGNFWSSLHRCISFRPEQVLLSSVAGAMGSGMPMAVALALPRPGKQIVAFMGDGGALMMDNEIATACQHGCAPMVMISDKAMYGMIGMHPRCALSRSQVHEGDAAGQSGLRRLRPIVWRGGITIREEPEVADGIAPAFAVKTRPVVVHCLASALQMSAWRRFQTEGSIQQ
jgi:acetolactate synthase-1/2/3 large subunit